MQARNNLLDHLKTKMATGILKVQGSKVVDSNGDEVLLRGAAIGGWMKYAVTQCLYFAPLK